MKNLTNVEMKNIYGGSISAGAAAAIAAGIAFFSGILDGFSRPFKCR